MAAVCSDCLHGEGFHSMLGCSRKDLVMHAFTNRPIAAFARCPCKRSYIQVRREAAGTICDKYPDRQKGA